MPRSKSPWDGEHSEMPMFFRVESAAHPKGEFRKYRKSLFFRRARRVRRGQLVFLGLMSFFVLFVV
jgi:hypothetical protein